MSALEPSRSKTHAGVTKMPMKFPNAELKTCWASEASVELG